MNQPSTAGTLFSPRFDRFFRTHEKILWQFSAIDFGGIRKELLTQEDIDAVRAAMLVESHNPVYTLRLLEFFRHDHEMASFAVTWAYEEMRHYAVLRTYLEATGMVDNQELAQSLDHTRKGDWGRDTLTMSAMQNYTYTMLQ